MKHKQGLGYQVWFVHLLPLEQCDRYEKLRLDQSAKFYSIHNGFRISRSLIDEETLEWLSFMLAG